MVTGRIFNLQDFSVQDGPGIRTTVFFKGCPLRCAWCCNPEGQAPDFELQFFAGLCRGCRQCREACPSSAVRFGADGRPRFRRDACRRCPDKPCVAACSGSALRAAGREAALDEIVRRIESNLPFYRNSGGGVTLSGGEPLRQPEFARAILEACRRRGVSIGLETCGAFAWDDVADFIGAFDFVYFDVKGLDGGRHRRLTGRASGPLLANLRRLARLAAPRVVVTVTLVPGVAEGRAEWSKIAALCRAIGVRRVRLLEYHDLGREKYPSLGRRYALAGAPGIDPAARPACARVMRAKGLRVERE